MQTVLIAFLSAILFGASTPIGKLLLKIIPPFQLAGLFYFGAALGVYPFFFREKNAVSIQRIGRKNGFRLTGAILFGGIAGPVLLLFGLRLASSASVSMWLNLELVATALLGILFFKDHLGKFGWLGVMGTILASTLLSWHEGGIGFLAVLFIGGASLCWGADNHLTALIDGITPSQSTFWKGMVAGATNIIISLVLEPVCLDFFYISSAILVGIFAYGFSITLYIYAAQNLGATRSQMIFASAPFFGVLLSSIILGESLSLIQVSAAFILIISLLVLFRDQHTHPHNHEAMYHKHRHHHKDGHHDHHSLTTVSSHVHWHTHNPFSHAHPHWPDMHHRHSHDV